MGCDCLRTAFALNVVGVDGLTPGLSLVDNLVLLCSASFLEEEANDFDPVAGDRLFLVALSVSAGALQANLLGTGPDDA